ncbi:hypothetical protein EFD56_21175 [Rhizobium phaseoli]|uniref:hypothetical protein n=1 Tax=Rhizobium phaseoli TaxID=396 RepID=UPI000F879511|nr:hypothetical protein [Rhizobium phaseoli]RUM16833.1 hypothetical protein EFD56_21175 [Rhizobium phaseoli]
MEMTREQLYELVWSTPALQAGPRLGISANYLARVCTALEVPRPGLGYWAKRGAGIAPPPPPLPPLRPGKPTSWEKGKTVGSAPRRVAPAKTVLPVDAEPARRGVSVHGLVKESLPHFDDATPGRDGYYLKPRKKLLVDVTVTASGLKKSLVFANELFNTLETLGHPVMIWRGDEVLIRIPIDTAEAGGQDGLSPSFSPLSPTVAFVHGVPIGIAIVETSEMVEKRYVGMGEYVNEADYRKEEHIEPTWKVWRAEPTGRLKVVAYSPFHDVPWKREWVETRKSVLTGTTGAIAAVLESAALDLVLRLEKAGRYLR